MLPEVEQKIYDVLASHGLFGKEAWFLLARMADDINADLHGLIGLGDID
mgnify:CR=1 FL=1